MWTYECVLDDSLGGLFVEGHGGFGVVGALFGVFQLVEVLLDAGEFLEDGVFHGVDAVEFEICWS